MSKLSTVATVSTTQQVTLRPAVARKLLTELQAYAELKASADAIDVAMKAHKASIRELREMTGEGSLSIEGFITTDVQGVSETLDKKKLLAQGVTTAQIEMATVRKPKKAYEKITLPGQRRGGQEED